MNYLTLIVEFHHPLPGPGDPVGPDWALASVTTYWPLLRVIADLANQRFASALTLAISPSWTALASDPTARDRMEAELDRRAGTSAHFRELRRFAVETWDLDLIALLRHIQDSHSAELIPTTASSTWLPSVATESILARAQVHLAALDHARRFGIHPEGIWLPHLGYLPGLESTLADSRLRYFGVSSESFVRGSVRPPYGLENPLITRPGVAAFAVRQDLTPYISDVAARYAQDRRYLDPEQTHRASAEHASHFLGKWREIPEQGPSVPKSGAIALAALAAHDLGDDWRGGPFWLSELARRASDMGDLRPITLGRYLDRYPEGVLGRPGASAGGPLSVRPEDSSVLDQCRMASETLTEAVAHARNGGPVARRCVAQMVRLLLQAQGLDWSTIPGHVVPPAKALERADRRLRLFHELAGSLASGRIDVARLAQIEAGPTYLAEIELERLA